MKNLRPALILTAALAFARAPQAGAQVIDQYQHNFGSPLAPSSGWQAQTFVPQYSMSAGAAVLLGNFQLVPDGSTYLLKMELWKGTPQSAGSAEPPPEFITQGQAEFSLGNAYPNNFTQLVQVFWPEAVEVTQTRYYITFFGGFGANSPAINYAPPNTEDPYPDGIAWFNWFTPGQTYTYGDDEGYYYPYPNHDYYFEEYASRSDAMPAPEPASTVLMATGLLALAGVARSRRKRRA